jgi:hypothetical protein
VVENERSPLCFLPPPFSLSPSPLLLLSFLAAATMDRRERARGGKLLLDKEGVAPDSKGKYRQTSLCGPQRAVRGGGQAAPIA